MDGDERSRSEAGSCLGNQDNLCTRLLYLDVGMRRNKDENLSTKGVTAYMVLDGITKSPHNLNGAVRYRISIFCINKCVFTVCDSIAPLEEDYINERLLVTKQVKRKIAYKADVRKDFET
jgi:hypothetical protein